MLCAELEREKLPEVKGAIARLLGTLKDPSSVGPLTSAIEFGNSDASGNAMNREIANALGRIGDSQSIPGILRLLTSRDPYTEIEAINALSALQAKSAVEPLIEIIAEPKTEPFIVKKAIQALGEIEDPRAVPVLVLLLFKEKRGVSFYVESSFALFQIGRPASDALLAVLR
jgi:HEAT repeat protein